MSLLLKLWLLLIQQCTVLHPQSVLSVVEFLSLNIIQVDSIDILELKEARPSQESLDIAQEYEPRCSGFLDPPPAETPSCSTLQPSPQKTGTEVRI